MRIRTKEFGYLISYSYKNKEGFGFGCYKLTIYKKVQQQNDSFIVDLINKEYNNEETIILNIIKM